MKKLLSALLVITFALFFVGCSGTVSTDGYTQGSKWTNMGGGLINGMITGVAQPVLAQVVDDKERQRNVLRKMIRFTAFVAFPLMFGLALVAEELIIITVTDKWLSCVPILQMLCVWGAFLPICELYKNVVISHGKSNVYLYANILFGVVQLLVLVAMVSWGILWMVAGYVVAYFFWLFAWHGFAHRCCGIRLHELLKDITPYLVITAFALSCGWWCASFFESLYVRFALKVLISALVYVLIMWRSGSMAFRESMSFLLRRFI